MSECPYQSRLGAYHDRELDAETSRQIETHLSGCSSCSDALRGIAAVSNLLNAAPSGRMSQMGLTRLHEAADSAAAAIAARRAGFPMMKGLMAITASILVIAGAWLVEIPSDNPAERRIAVQPTHMADWERLASGERDAVPSDIQPQTGTANAAFSNEMLDGLRSK